MTEKRNYNLWDDYLTIGMAVAILLTLFDCPRDHFYLTIPFGILFFFAGWKDNFKILGKFLKKYWILVPVVLVYEGYFFLVNRSLYSMKYIVALFCVVFGGYLASRRLEDETEIAYTKLWILILAVILLGICKMMGRLPHGYYVDNSVEFYVVVIFAIFSLLFFKELWIRIISIVSALWSIVLVIKRDAIHLSNLMAIKRILPVYFAGSRTEEVFGRGQLAAHYVVTDDYFENTFATLLFDYGLLMFGLYMLGFLFAIVLIVRTKDDMLKKQAFLVCIMILASVFFSAQYWSNSFYILGTGMGILVGRFDQVKEKMKNENGEIDKSVADMKVEEI